MKAFQIAAIIIFGAFCCTGTKMNAQESNDSNFIGTEKYTAHNKGKFYLYWGWNRGYYSNSSVRFTGDDYDFTLYNAVAHDEPSKLDLDYIHPKRVTSVQTNVRLGYFFSDHYNVSLGIDHMKYIMTVGQTVDISGYIDLPEGNPYNGTYQNEPIYVDDEFLHLEHTNGLNLINVQVERYDDLGTLLGGKWNMDIFQINLYEGIGAGVLVPRTDATILNKEQYDEFHLSGFGLSAHQGLNLTFFKHFFLQFELKEGYINMSDIRTTYSKNDKASQNFFYLEPTFMFGGIFRL